MKLPMRQHKKRDQALDAFASVAKTWSEWRLGERATKTVSKGAKKAAKTAKKASPGRKSSPLSAALKGTPMKVAGALAVVGGIGAAVAKKLKGSGHAEPIYTPPPAPAPFDPPAALADMPPAPPTPVAVEDLAPAKAEPESADAEASSDAEGGTDDAADADADADAASDDEAGEPAAEGDAEPTDDDSKAKSKKS